MSVWFHGVMDRQLGHFWFDLDGRCVSRHMPDIPWVDSGWAPRTWKMGYHHNRSLVADISVCRATEGKNDEERRRIFWDTEEHPQGNALRSICGSYTVVSWWDRCQGDHRANCNSTLVGTGDRTYESMIQSLREYWPNVIRNMEAKGVFLHQVVPRGEAVA